MGLKFLMKTLPFIVFLIIVIGFKWGTLNLPLYWDEIAVYAGPVFDLYNHGPMYLTQPDANFNHPYGLQIVLASLFTLFGPSYAVMRIFCALMAAITMYCLYDFGSEKKGPLLGYSAALLFFFLPEVFVQAPLMIGDNVIAAYGVIFALLLYREKYYAALAMGLLMGFTRETAVAYTPFAFLFVLLERNLSIKSILASLGPVISLSVYFAYKKIIALTLTTTSHGLNHNISFDRPLSEVYSLFTSSYEQVFTERGKSFLVYIALSALLILVAAKVLTKINFAIKTPRIRLSFILPLIVLYSSFILLFSFHSQLLIRYFYPLLPFTALICCYLIAHINKYLPLLALALIPIEFYPLYNINACNTAIATGQEYDMEYTSVIETHKRGADYIMETYNKEGNVICTGWPIIVELEKDYAGYIKTKSLFKIKDGFYDDCDVLIIANNMDRNVYKLREPLLKEGRIKLKKRIDHQCKYYEIYETEPYNKI